MSLLDEHRDEIAAKVLAGASQRDIARRYGVSRDTVQRFLHKQGIKTAPPPAIKAPVTGPVQDLEILTAEVKELRKAANTQREADVVAERMVREVREAVQATPVKYTAPTLDDSDPTKAKHVQVLLLSDLHAGEIVDPVAVNGMNEYSWEILVERMKRIQRSLLSFAAHRPYPISELHVWNLGDMVGGEHHAELAATNEYPSAEQAYKTGMLLGQWFEELVPHYPLVELKGVVGNHGRVPQKPANKLAHNSFDWLAYKIAEVYLGAYVDMGVVTCDFSRASQMLVEIAGRTAMLWHGDGVRSSMPGVPWGGVMRRVNEFRKQFSNQGLHVDYFALGHFHDPNVVKSSIFMNGSVKGVDEYSLKQFGSGEPPTQLLLTFNADKRRLTDVSFITP